MVQAFHNVRFPEDISYGVTGGPEFSVNITKTKAGIEQRNLNREEGQCKYNAAYGIRTQSHYKRVLSFFRARKGKTFSFRFKDWLDYKAESQDIGTAIADTGHFQLVKLYFDGVGEDIRKITKPVPGTVKVFIDGIQTQHFTCNTMTGLVTITGMSATEEKPLTVSASFEFDVPVRFDIDQMSASYDNYDNYSWQDIPLVEVLE